MYVPDSDKLTNAEQADIAATLLERCAPGLSFTKAHAYATEIIEVRDSERRMLEHILLTPLDQAFSDGLWTMGD
jgi:hypothetical protein